MVPGGMQRWKLGVGLACAALVLGCADRQESATADGLPGVEPREIAFGRQPLYEGQLREVRVSNFGRAELEVIEAWTEGPEGTFKATFDEAGPHRVQPGGDCLLRVRFTPQADGAQPGTLVVRTDSVLVPLLRVPLTGEGVDVQATVAPELLDFGRIEIQARATRSLVVENLADLPTELRVRLIGADADEFRVPGAVTLAPGERREIQVEWSPVREGRKQVALGITRCTGCNDTVVRIAAEALERAVVAEPSPLDFGPTPLDREVERTVILRNLSTEPQTVNGLALAPGTDVSFTPGSATWPQTIPAGGTVEVPFLYSPGHLGSALGQAEFDVVSVRHDTLPLGLRGHGGAPELCVAPLDLDFGEQPVGAKAVLTINVKNCGTRNAQPLTVTAIEVQGFAGGAAPFGAIAPALPLTLAAGEEFDLQVFYEPTGAGAATGTLRLITTGGTAGPVVVSLQGSAREVAPCEVAVAPEALDFGTVLPGWGAVLVVRITSLSSDLCPVKNLGLTDDGGGVFLLPGGRVEGLVLPAGGSFSVMVGYRAPPAGGTFTGRLAFEVAHPLIPVRVVPLAAHAQQSCLVAAPNFLDFGVSRPDCPPEPREVGFLNQCTTPVVVTAAEIGPGSMDGEFSLTRGLGGPETLAPGDTLTLEAAYAAQSRGLNASPLFISTEELPAPLLVPLIGESTTRVDVVDDFVQTDGQKVDVLFVVDNTGSMVEEQPRFRAALPAFASAAQARGVDMNVAITTTGIEPAPAGCPGGASGGEAGRIFPADGSTRRLLTSAMPDLGAALQANAEVGLCAVVEKGFEAVRRALSPPLVNNADDPRTPLAADGNFGFLRDSASLVVVFVGDEDDHSPDAVETYVQFLRTLKGVGQPQRMTIHAIAPSAGGCASAGGEGLRYAEAVRQTGGSMLSACAADYAPLLRQIAEQSLGPQRSFPLSATADPGSLEVRLDGTALSSGWDYDPATNAIVFDTEPAAGAQVQVLYRRTCG